MSRLRLLVLGPPRLERDGQPAELHLRRALGLLVYLAVTERPQGREALAPCSGRRPTRATAAAARAAPSTA
jgi:hypothetical protein